MVYSKAFETLPERVKSAVIRQLKAIINSAPSLGKHLNIKASERKRIAEILAETLPAWQPK